MVKTLKLSSYKDSQTGKIYIKDPSTGEATDAFVEVMGGENKTRKALDNAKIDKLKKAFAASQYKVAPIESADNQYTRETEYLTSISVGVGNFDDIQNPVDFRAIYTNPDLQWLRKQVLAGTDDVKNFIETAPANS